MKKSLRRLMTATSLLVLPLLLTQCASTDSSSGSDARMSGWGGIYADDPMYQQIRMQQQMSQVTRSLIPF